jgi:ribosomal protein L17
MDLSAEDNLRINVLLAQKLQAVRIDESKMIVYALTDRGEAKVALNPNCKDEKYIKQVKSVLSTHVMGSPGGYPVFLKRWTRMGQAREETLGQLLLLGEPEAVVAAVHAKGLSDELAERAWWAMPTSENARRMLEKDAVVQGKTGKVLAEFLLEFLPFEEDQRDMIESVRLVLQPGLISEAQKLSLWSKASTRRSFYVGFLHALPDDLPEDTHARDDLDALAEKLAPLVDSGNTAAALLLKLHTSAGQAFLKTVENALKKPGDQHVVESLFDAIARYFSAVKLQHCTAHDIMQICSEAEARCEHCDADIAALIAVIPELKNEIRAMLVLSSLSVLLLNPVFSRSDAIGTVMRKKIKHITDPVLDQIKTLQGRD